MEQLRLSPLISEEEIQERVRKMGAAISDKYRGKDLIVVGVLKGSFMFYADLIRYIDTDLECDFCGVSSYADAMASA